MNNEFALSRITLKPIKHRDCSALWAILSEPLVAQFNDYAVPLARDDVKQLIQDDITGMYEGNTLRFGMYLLNTSTLIGCIGLYDIEEDTAWLGFELSPNHWGNGFMSEALAFMLTNITAVVAQLGNELSITNLQAKVATENSQSQQLLRRFKFTHVASEQWLYQL
ncbi:GNAT family N-acetyltransferase [Pseudoalteromonas sp. SR44-5]|uniref:GNAT family N-acetyltransferase n=1 Tax=Pseudoalteromonas TaxID=53246 RepID=UPI0016020BB9|nr:MULTISPECIES: GNAT family N-acetyltransferase [unclassified Pseudoalteromonas]MBB1343418.1 GNAT family N-acetyltransferase [Pseudoalteromonas sp. SR45-6]MBB1367780.1 GNAT family N-acetyltransferase [Pseudoalteromonas sp. SR44-5]MBB1419347.1 GNAT family N-acetyltransferase [Pseudoalteromonas sp. SG44-1]MBB1423361.1 GNAT family N-acetyltransferase [Pseudoalteromonas sp. SG43-7]MBB1434516.1 GNAT family N-acetyltransferase [Pseudoalteromonas sp. SG43-6]